MAPARRLAGALDERACVQTDRRHAALRLAAAAAFLMAGTVPGARAQALKDVQTADTPLVLKSQGSFFVGGDTVEQTQGSWATSVRADASPSTRCTSASWSRRGPRAGSRS